VLVRGLQSGLRPAPWSFHRTFIEHPVLTSNVRFRFMMDTVAPVGG
jgi:hypothetical protein